MQYHMIKNLDLDEYLALWGVMVDNFGARLRGWLGRKELEFNEALIIIPCNMVHSLGMKIPTDIIFVGKNGEIIHLMEGMQPGKISPLVKKAHYVIELPAGKIKASATCIGHRILLER